MTETVTVQEVLPIIQAKLGAARQRARKLRTTNLSLVIAGILAGGLSTLIAAFGASLGATVFKGSGPTGWQIVCGSAAVLSFAATVTSGLAEQLGTATKLAQALACTGRLAALETALSLQSQSLNEVKAELTRILGEYGDVFDA